jgi:L-threonylcarbamoyladenylate synthase
MARHYSPRTPVVLADDADAEHRRLACAGLRVISVGAGHVFDYVRVPDDPAEYAAVLYATLHDLDDGRFDRIVLALPPDTPEWAAVRDRLTRAAAPG